MAKGGPDLTSQGRSVGRAQKARSTFGDDTMGDDVLARYGRDPRMHGEMDWQERENSATNTSDQGDLVTSEDALVAGMPDWGRQKGPFARMRRGR